MELIEPTYIQNNLCVSPFEGMEVLTIMVEG